MITGDLATAAGAAVAAESGVASLVIGVGGLLLVCAWVAWWFGPSIARYCGFALWWIGWCCGLGGVAHLAAHFRADLRSRRTPVAPPTAESSDTTGAQVDRG